jgi:hypothetical protein
MIQSSYIRPTNVDMLIEVEFSDMRHHIACAAHWAEAAQLVRAEVADDYVAEVKYHLAAARQHYSTAIGWASR